MYRFSRKLRENRPALNACVDACAASLRSQYPELGRDVAIDASNLPAFANGQKFVRKGGPERERYSDPDASWGHRSALATRAAGSFYGYKIHMAVDVKTDLPLAWEISTAKRNESKFVAPLLDALHARGFRPETVACDKAYDHVFVYAECEARECEPIIPLRGTMKNQPALPLAIGGQLFPRIPRHTERCRDLYGGRGAVEREFGRLKHDHGLDRLRVRGLDRVQLHADLTILARIAQALWRTRQITALAA
jgi:hypothetical protein